MEKPLLPSGRYRIDPTGPFDNDSEAFDVHCLLNGGGGYCILLLFPAVKHVL